MSKVIACVNEKGGVAKTTTVKNLSIGLAMKGKKVLAIDIDPSANLTKCLGIAPENDNAGICEILSKSIGFEDVPEGMGIIHQAEGIDIITSSNSLHLYEAKLFGAMQKEEALGRYVDTIRDKYDYIFIDCPAGLGIFTINALYCADSVIIPVSPQFLSVEAMQNLYVMIAMVRKANKTNKKPDIMGILFAAVRPNTNNDKNIMLDLKKSSSASVRFFDTIIPLASKIPESDLARESIFKYAPNTTAALNYGDLVNEVLRLEKEEA